MAENLIMQSLYNEWKREFLQPVLITKPWDPLAKTVGAAGLKPSQDTINKYQKLHIDTSGIRMCFFWIQYVQYPTHAELPFGHNNIKAGKIKGHTEYFVQSRSISWQRPNY